MPAALDVENFPEVEWLGESGKASSQVGDVQRVRRLELFFDQSAADLYRQFEFESPLPPFTLFVYLEAAITEPWNCLHAGEQVTAFFLRGKWAQLHRRIEHCRRSGRKRFKNVPLGIFRHGRSLWVYGQFAAKQRWIL